MFAGALGVTSPVYSQAIYDPFAVVTLAGNAGSIGSADGLSYVARFNGPQGIAVASDGNVYIADTGSHTIRKITPAGLVTTLAGTPGVEGSVDGIGSAASFKLPQGVAVDNSGTVYVSDSSNNTIRKITPAGVVTTFAGLAGNAGSSDGAGAVARFFFPIGLATDSHGNVYVADNGNSTIRKITGAGVVSTLAGASGSPGSADGLGTAAHFAFPSGVAIDGSGNLFVADTSNQAIRKITSAGMVTTLAGMAGVAGSADGTGSAARFKNPRDLAIDSAGSIYVADTGNNTIRRVTPAGVVTTLAGLAGAVGTTNGAGSTARFDTPHGIASTGGGRLYVADTSSHTIRRGAKHGTLLANISTRVRVETGDSALIGGFIVTGTQPKKVIIRALGPSLPLTDKLTDPTLELYGPNGLITTNDNWQSADNVQEILDSTIPPSNPLESAIVASLPANNSSYTAIARGVAGEAGVGLFEVYDLDGTCDSKLVNISSRGLVLVGDNAMIAGFVITGSAAQKIIVRALGPSLAVAGNLANPTLQLFDVNGVSLGFNDNWRSDQEAEIIASTIPPSNDLESSIVQTLSPASYTVIVRGVNNTAGLALVDLYTLNTSARVSSITRPDPGHVMLQGNGVANTLYVVQASPDLNPADFAFLGNITSDALGAWQFTDTPPIGLRNRFYRLVTP